MDLQSFLAGIEDSAGESHGVSSSRHTHTVVNLALELVRQSCLGDDSKFQDFFSQKCFNGQAPYFEIEPTSSVSNLTVSPRGLELARESAY